MGVASMVSILAVHADTCMPNCALVRLFHMQKRIMVSDLGGRVIWWPAKRGRGTERGTVRRGGPCSKVARHAGWTSQVASH